MRILVYILFFSLGSQLVEASWHQFDPKTRTEQWALSEEKEIEWVYDACGNRIIWKDWAGAVLYDYDEADRLREVVTPSGEKKSYVFDAGGHLRKIVYPSMSEVHYDYTSDGELAEVVFCGQRIEYIYEANSRLLVLKKLPNGIKTEYKYDLARQLTDIIHKNAQDILMVHFHFEYDFMGNRILTKKITSKDEIITTYAYDKLYRLKKASSSDGSFEKYTYKANGDRASKKTPFGVVQYEYGDDYFKAGETLYVYDQNGNVCKKSSTNGIVEYVYNELNQLVEYKDEINKVVFSYNGQGERLWKDVNGKKTFYSYDDVFPVFQILEERSEEKIREYFYGLAPIGYKENGKFHYYLEESLSNSVGFIIDESGTIIKELKYETFGCSPNPCEESIHYAGELRDPETGLIFLRTRYYDPEIGRFLSPDQVPGNIYDPQSWNRYVYVKNNPLKFIDPMGTIPVAPKDKIKPIFWTNGQPIWKEGNPLPPEGWTILAVCARQGGAFTNNPLKKQMFREAHEMGGHGWIEVINSKGSHASYSVCKTTPPNLCVDDAIAYRYDKHTIRLAYLVPDEIAETAKENIKKFSEQNYHLFLHNCVHATREGAAAAGITELFVEAQWMPEGDGYEMEYQSLIKPSKVHKNIENKIQELGLMQRWDETTLENAVKDWENAANNLAQTSNSRGNFGGISLSKKAEMQVDLKEIYGAVFDGGTEQLILIGKKSLELPEMALDDLAVATQSIYGLRGGIPEDPGVSIEPSVQLGEDGLMQVRYLGGTYSTEFGRILFEGDLTLKKLILGELSCSIPGFSSAIDRQTSGECLLAFPHFAARHWLEPEHVSLIESMDGSAMVFDEVRMHCLSETTLNGEKIVCPEQEVFASHFSENYDAIAQEYPIFSQVKRLGQITAVVKWLRENEVPFDTSFFESYTPIEAYTPLTIPVLKKKYLYSNMPFQTFGGIYLKLDACNYTVEKEVGVGSFKEQVLGSRPSETEFAWDLDNNWAAEALPLVKTRKTGNFQRSFIDLQFPAPGEFPLVFTRYYDSFRDEDVGLGRGWAVTPFDLKIGEKVIFEVEGESYVLDRFLVVREGNQDWVYHPHQKSADGKIWYLREDRQQKVCIHPDQSFELVLRGGNQVFFDTNGRLVRTLDKHKIAIDFIYEESLLRRICHQNGKSLDLAYKEERITSVTCSDRALYYSFNDQQGLVEITAENERVLMTYGYDEDQRLCSIVDAQNNPLFEGSYDDYNRLKTIKVGMAFLECNYDLSACTASWNIPGGSKIRSLFNRDYQVKEIEGELTTAFIEGSRVELEEGWEREYDDRNLLARITDPSGSTWKFHYNAAGNLLMKENPKGEITCYRYDQDERLIMKMEHVKHVKLDQSGTVILFSVAKPEYCTSYTYKMGKVETLGNNLGQFRYNYDENGLLKEITMPSGYWIQRSLDEHFRPKEIRDAYGVIEEYEYEENYLAVITPSGKMETYFDKMGKISHQIDRNGNLTRFNYSQAGKLEFIEDAEGLLHPIEHL